MAFEPNVVKSSTLELRLATTITGGVSLAIWMAGIAREINLLAQASQWRRKGGACPSDVLSKPAAESLELYARLIDLLDMVVDVDILSGTSAGGINAALLASSRVTGTDLGGLCDLWLDLGALTDLLRDPRDKSTPSLLYGDERMYADLAAEIPELAKGPFPPEAGAKPPSTTLYVTTTLLTGETGRFTDAYGTLVQDVDRRGIFTFTQKDLAPLAQKDKDTTAALALAARCSASFPLAFEPSFVPFTKATAKTQRVPARPPMERFANITRPHWVVDGGLLDNQPIDVLLQRVFDRPARRPVRRVLLFVVPSSGPAPSLTEEAPPDKVNEPLGLVEALLKDLTAATTQSIAAQLRAIRVHQDRMEARTDAKQRLAEFAAKSGSRLLTTSLLADYVKREATKHAHALTTALLRQLSTWPSASSGLPNCVPEQWESELRIGGDVERVCRGRITERIRKRWSQPGERPLPQNLADFARYGRPAYDVAKGCAIAVIGAASQLAKTDKDLTTLAHLTEAVHRACKPPEAIDLGELVRTVYTQKQIREESLVAAADALADAYLELSKVPIEAWNSLGGALVRGYYDTLKRLADDTAPASAAEQDPLLTAAQLEENAAEQLNTYLTYLRPGYNRWIMAWKLFDLAVTQRAMLPAEADIEQYLQLVQVSADTRCLFAPDWETAQQKLTGMQFHHFGAFYKRSWRANDWMWGRLDGAGWLVHLLLDPQRVLWIAESRAAQGSRVQWFLDELKELGNLDLPSPDGIVTEDMLIKELAFLDHPAETVPPSIPWTALWLAQAWQQRVLDEELDRLADTVIDPQPGKRPDWSPTKSRSWAKLVKETPAGKAKYKLLNSNPIATETFASDKGSPLMAQTITKAAATGSAAVGSVRQMPGVLKPPVITLRTLALGGYQVVSTTKGVAKWTLIAGTVSLVLGIAAAIQSAPGFGTGGLILIGIGGYLIVFGTWQLSLKALVPGLSFAVVLGMVALAIRDVRTWLFGTDKGHSGVVGAHVYWLGTQWWHPLIVVVGIALAITLTAVGISRRK